MQIQLNQVELETAVVDFIQKQGISLVDKSVTVTFTQGRKDGNGTTADVEIEPRNINTESRVPEKPAEVDSADEPVIIQDAEVVPVTSSLFAQA